MGDVKKDTVSAAMSSARDIIDAWCTRYVDGMPPATARDKLITDILALSAADDDETYEIGKRDGYEQAVQEIDVRTGGDGEYRFCTDHDPDRHTPTPAHMIERIVERFDTLALRQPDTSERGGDIKVGDTVRILRARNAYGQDVSIGKPFTIGETFVVGSVQDEDSFPSGIVFPEGENCEFWRADDLEIISAPPPNKSPTPEHVEGDVSVGGMENLIERLRSRPGEAITRTERLMDEAANALSAAQSSIQRAERERNEAQTEASAWANKSLEHVGTLRAQLEEARKVLERIKGVVTYPCDTSIQARGYGTRSIDITGCEYIAEAVDAFLASLREKQDAE